jgi:hypothetical protein
MIHRYMIHIKKKNHNSSGIKLSTNLGLED